MPAMTPRKLIALDEDDLAVISAHVQDARVRTGNILWRQGEKRLVIGLERLDLDQELDGQQAGHLVSALRFDRVLSVKSRNVATDKPDAAIESDRARIHRNRRAKRQGHAIVLRPWRHAGRGRMP